MRVELFYAPGCRTYQKALQVLESVIADERLPIPVELVEHDAANPIIRINGSEVNSHENDHLRDRLNASWHELTAMAL